MAQIWIEIDDNENCGYFPVQVFEVLGQPEKGRRLVAEEVPGRTGPQEIVGWCSDDGGTPCEVVAVVIGDSGSGQSRLVRGGDNGIRMRSADSTADWDLDNHDQAGEPYLLMNVQSDYSLE